MRNISIAVIVVAVLAIGVSTILSSNGQFGIPIDPEAERIISTGSENVPMSFADFPVEWNQAVEVNFESEINNSLFVSMIPPELEAGFKINGVNFAKKFSLITWSCGVGCQQTSIIDASTNTLTSFGVLSSYGISYSNDSTLLIVNPEANLPKENIPIGIETDFYEVLEDGTLEHVLKRIPGEGDIDTCLRVEVLAKNPVTTLTKTFTTSCSIPFGWEVQQ